MNLAGILDPISLLVRSLSLGVYPAFNAGINGLMDLAGYDSFFRGKLRDFALPQEDLAASLESIAGLPKPPIRTTGKW